MPAFESLLGRIGGGLFQQAYVVTDLAVAQAAGDLFGCQTWATLPVADLDYDYRGGRATCALAIAFGRSGDVQLELIQPVRGEGLHAEFLRDHGPGFHHQGFLVDDLDAVVRDAGFENVMGGRFGSLRFCYLDTWENAGMYVELVEDPDQMMWQLMPWRGSDVSARTREPSM